jgi:F0F1-type ATP synthase membrane subunit b/b'
MTRQTVTVVCYWFNYLFICSQALSFAEQERSAVQERLSSVQRELAAAVAEHGRQKRELTGRQEQQANVIDSLQSELKNLRDHLDETSLVICRYTYLYNVHLKL